MTPGEILDPGCCGTWVNGTNPSRLLHTAARLLGWPVAGRVAGRDLPPHALLHVYETSNVGEGWRHKHADSVAVEQRLDAAPLSPPRYGPAEPTASGLAGVTTSMRLAGRSGRE